MSSLLSEFSHPKYSIRGRHGRGAKTVLRILHSIPYSQFSWPGFALNSFHAGADLGKQRIMAQMADCLSCMGKLDWILDFRLMWFQWLQASEDWNIRSAIYIFFSISQPATGNYMLDSYNINHSNACLFYFNQLAHPVSKLMLKLFSTREISYHIYHKDNDTFYYSYFLRHMKVIHRVYNKVA